MDRTAAQAVLADAEVIPCLEGNLPSAKELERECLAREIPVVIAKAPPKECCAGGGCACGSKVQVLVREEDLPKIQAFFHEQWNAAAQSEGLAQVAPKNTGEPTGELACPACGTAAPLVEGACSDCGLQLE